MMSGSGPNPLRQTAGARAPTAVRSLGQVEGRIAIQRVEGAAGYGGLDPDDRAHRGPLRVRLSATARALIDAGEQGFVLKPTDDERRQQRYQFEGRNHTLVMYEAAIAEAESFGDDQSIDEDEVDDEEDWDAAWEDEVEPYLDEGDEAA